MEKGEVGAGGHKKTAGLFSVGGLRRGFLQVRTYLSAAEGENQK